KYVTGIESTSNFTRTHCIPCVIGKHPAQPYPKRGNRATKLLELVHMDTCGPFSTMTPQKHRYFYVMLDDASNLGFTSNLTHKSFALSHFKKVKSLWEKQTGKKIK